MNKNELRVAIKDAIVPTLLSTFPNAIQIDDYKFAVPVGNLDGTGEKYVKIDVTAAQWYDTATVEAFDPNAAIEAYEQKVTDRNKAKAEKEAKKKEQPSKKSRKKKSDEDED